MRKQNFRIVSILLGIFFIISLSKDLQQLLSAKERIEKGQQDVVSLEAEQQKLAKELEYAMSEEFVEKEAREKLLMSKPGEVVVLLPPEEERDGVSDESLDEGEREFANWEKWVQLFF